MKYDFIFVVKSNKKSDIEKFIENGLIHLLKVSNKQ